MFRKKRMHFATISNENPQSQKKKNWALSVQLRAALQQRLCSPGGAAAFVTWKRERLGVRTFKWAPCAHVMPKTGHSGAPRSGAHGTHGALSSCGIVLKPKNRVRATHLCLGNSA